MITKSFLKELTYQITGACIEVHKALGPGLLESIYHKCLIHEFTLRGINFISEITIPVEYKGINVQTNLRCDFIVEDAILIDLKSKETVLPIDQAKILSYMKLLQKPKGIIVNFNVVNIFHEGQQTFVNEFFTNLPE